MRLGIPEANDLTIRIKLDGERMYNLANGKRILGLVVFGSKVTQRGEALWQCVRHPLIQLRTETGIASCALVESLGRVVPAFVEEFKHLGEALGFLGERLSAPTGVIE